MKIAHKTLSALLIYLSVLPASAQTDSVVDELPVFGIAAGLSPQQVMDRLTTDGRYSVKETRARYAGQSYIGLLQASWSRPMGDTETDKKAIDVIYVHFTPPGLRNLSYLSYRKRRFSRHNRPDPARFKAGVINQFGEPDLDARKHYQPNMKTRWFWNLDGNSRLACRTDFTSMVKRYSSALAFDRLKNHVRVTTLRCPDYFRYLETIEGQSAASASYDRLIEFDAFSIDYAVLVRAANVPARK